MICKNVMRKAIVSWCKTNRSYLDSQFVDPLTDVEFNNALNPENWLLHSERAHPDDMKIDGFKIVNGICKESDYDDCYNGWSFDCEPFDDQLSAYVSVDDNDEVTNVRVQGR